MAARRAARKEERWQEVTTQPAAPVRQRGRKLAEGDDVTDANTWDDVEWRPDEVEAAEAQVRSATAASDAVARACADATARWDEHYAVNLTNYHDRRYLLNEFEPLAAAAAASAELTVLEAGCGAGNSIFPLLAASPRIRCIGFDISPRAIQLIRERLTREGLHDRARALVWDVSTPPPTAELPPLPVADVVLAIFTLSALAPSALPAAFAHLHATLRPGGVLLLRDYGRLDLKQMKFAGTRGSQLSEVGGGGGDGGDGVDGGGNGADGSGSGARDAKCRRGSEWYARGDGTTVLFFTTDRVRALATEAGFEVDDCRYDRRLVVNRRDGTRMQRVWVVSVLRKAADTSQK